MSHRRPSTLENVLFLSLVGVLTVRPIPAQAAVVQSIQNPGAPASEPRPCLYREIGGQKLNAYVFMPTVRDMKKPASAVLLFHGGGWVAGSAEWVFEAAARFAGLGMVAVAVDYRLSEGKVTPIEALDDTRAAFRWIRGKASEFNIDPKRVAGYGVSAGGHLVAAAATIDFPGDKIDGTNSKPDLLLLWSPALDVAADGWFVQLLQGRGKAQDFSPSEHAGASTPPTCIVNGDKDTLTPLPRALHFRDLVFKAGGVCELHIYPGVGHLLTRNLADQENNFDPDPTFRADGINQQVRFLKKRGFINPAS